MSCVTGKICYEEKEVAREALIANHIRNDHREGSGPVNIYLCHDCEQWHFTSQGSVAEFLTDSSLKSRIAKEKQLRKWSEGF